MKDLKGLQRGRLKISVASTANYFAQQLLAIFSQRFPTVTVSLATFPERGSYPPELLALGIREYRQSFFKPYRVIYRVIGKQVIIYVITDGRRNMKSLLARRLLGA